MTATRILRAHFAWAILALATPVVAAPFNYANTTSGTFDDKGGAGQDPLVRTFNVTDDFTVNDLNVGLYVTHDWRGDVMASLEGPDGTSVAIILPADTSDNFNNYEILLDDASGAPLNDGNDDTSGTPYIRTVAPSLPLSTFNGKYAKGTWTLRIWDRQLGATSERVGTFNESTLFFDGTAVTTPSLESSRIKGTVFRDYDADGIHDFGEAGVGGALIRAYNSSGTQVASTFTDFFGDYVLSGLSNSAEVRLELTAMPSPLVAGATASGVGSRVQFITTPAVEVDFATHNPAEHVSNPNPRVLVPCYENGLSAGNANAGFVSFTYGADGEPSAYGGSAENPRVDAEVQELGAVWGVAFQPLQQRAFTSAFLKRHVDFADGPGYVYVLDYATAGVPLAGSFNLEGVSPANGGAAIALGSVDRSTVDAGDNYVLGDPASPNRDFDAFAKVGTISYGDADVTEDGQTLFLVNLNQRALISVDVSGATGSLPGTVNQYPLGGITVNGGPQTFDGLASNGVMRPWGLAFHDGKGYLGVVNDASSGTASDLHAYVFTFDPADPAAGLTQIVDFALDYGREYGQPGAAAGVGDFRPWASTWAALNPQTNGSDDNYMAPQPILSDLEINELGDLVIGITDRFSHQNGRQNYRAILDDPGSPHDGNPNEVLWDTNAMGDLVHACWNGATFIVEGFAGCPVGDNNRVTGDSGNTLRQDDGVNGNGEYYFEDHFMESGSGNLSFTHGETATGSLAHLPGSRNVISTHYDPLWPPEFPRIVNAQGVVWHDTFLGTRTQAYQVVASSTTSPQTFAKSNGLGDLELMASVAPIEIGNRVWIDTDRDGIQDPGESTLAGVTVTLHDMDAAGVQVGSAVTDSDGLYVFGGASDANMTGGSVLPDTNYQLRISLADSNLGGRLPTLVNQDPKGLNDSDAIMTGGNAVIAFATGGYGENDHTRDFGFQTGGLGIGNLVFLDANGNGVYDAGEGVDGVEVQVHDSFLLPPNTLIARTTTAGGGAYSFTGLVAGAYFIHIPATEFQAGGPLEGALSLIAYGTDTQTDDNGDENGFNASDPAATGVTSGDISLSSGSEPSNVTSETGFDAATDDGAEDSNIDLTVDMGFFPAADVASVSNRAWVDTNGNGIQDGGEPGLNGVIVDLLDASGNPLFDGTGSQIFTTTAGGGLYSFSNLSPGNYLVQFTLPINYFFSPQDAGDDANDSDPNPANGRVAITLSAGENDDSVDVGAYQLGSIGNFVWEDLDGNGIQDDGATGINGVTVRLYDSTGSTQLDLIGTSGGGSYSFGNRAPGDYIVEFVPPGAYFLTQQDAGGNDALDSDPNLTTNRTVAVSVTSGQANNTVDAGMYQTGIINGFVRKDIDGNGTGDAAISGVTVFLDPNNNGVLDGGEASTTTTGVGFYTFPGLAPGTYNVVEVDLANYRSIGDTDGGDPNRTLSVAVTSNNTTSGIDFTDEELGSISGTVLADTDNNDSGDTAIQNVTVFLDTNGNGTLDGGEPTDLTDASGFYSFTGLLPGNYNVVEVDLANYQSVSDTDGGDANVTSPVAVAAGASVANIDFVDEELSGISGTVLADTDNNDSGDSALQNVTVFLDTNGNGTLDGGEPNDLTNASGFYEFTGLAPGNYNVVEVDLANYQSISDTDGGDANVTSPVAVAAGASVANIDFVDEELGGISGTVLADTDNNDSGDSALQNITVFLDTNGNGTLDGGEPTDLTDASGFYSFTALAPGNFNVVEVDLANYQSISDTDGGDANVTSPVAVTAGATTANIDFVDEELGGISGTVLADTDNNDSGDSAIQNVTVFLDTNGNGTLDGGEPNDLTNASGFYEFTGLAPGNYNVVEVDLANYQSISDTDGGDANVTSPVAVTAGASVANIDFVDEELGGISGTVLADTDNNDSGDTALQNVTVFLDTNGNGSLDGGEPTDLTDASGFYSFSALAPGDYNVVEVDLANYQSVSDTDGGDANVTSPVSVTAGATTLGIDFVDEELGGISGTVLADTNNDDSGDSALQNVTVFLDTNGNGTLDGGEPTDLTDASGFYSFAPLAPGDYNVVEVDLANYQSISDTDGGDANVTSPVSVTAGATTANIDFVDEELGGISGTVLADTDNNDSGDSALQNVTVFLDTNGNGTLDGGEPTDLTDASGFYSFSALAPGDYNVVEVDLANYQSVSDTDGGDPNVTSPVTVNAGATTANIDFVDEELGGISGTVLADTDNNDSGDSALQNVTVFLDTNGNGTLDGGEPNDLTDASGFYEFTGLAPGDYNVVEVDLANYQSISDTDGGDANVTSPVTVTAGATTANIDFVDEELGAISGTVLADTDNNDLGDTAIQNVTVFLDTNGNGTLDGGEPNDLTDAAGFYEFTGLAPGDFNVVEVDLANYQSISDTDGGDANVTSPVAVTAGATTANIDFVDEELGGISGTVLADTDNNDSGDSALQNVTVFLDTNGNGSLDGEEPTDLTDAGGFYSFSALAPGDYNVVEVDLANYQSVSDTDGGDANVTSPVTVNAGATTANIDFVDEELAALGDKVWTDVNGNGIDDDGINLTGVTVHLYALPDLVTPAYSDTTGGGGLYAFTGLAPGDYVVEFLLTGGRLFTSKDTGGNEALDSDVNPGTGRTDTITLAAGQTNADIDAGTYLLGGLTGTVRADTDNNDSGDSPLANVTVFLDTNDNGILDGGETSVLTNASGVYTFVGLVPGSYNVVEVDLANYQSVSDTDGGDPNRTQGVAVASGLTTNNIDFVDEELASIGDFVWHDENFNGIQDGGEPGLDGVTVNLLDTSGTIQYDTTTTTGGGAWSFSGLNPANYIIEFVKPAGFVASPEDQGGNDALDSDADAGDGRSPFITLSAGENDDSIDAGFDERVGVGNVVFIDANLNGTFDSGEGVSGVTVHLFAQGDDPKVAAPLISALTNSGGNFLFTALEPGTYFLHVPAGMFATGPLAGNVAIRIAGADDGTDDDGDQNAIYYGDPKVEGSSSIEFTLGFGTEPVDAGSETGDSPLLDGPFKDDNVDLTIDLGYYAGCGISATPGNIVRNDEGTPFLSDDTFQFDVTVTATNGDPFGWSANRLDGPSEFPSGSYGVVTPFGPYAITETPSYQFDDFDFFALDPCTFILTVPAPAVAPARIANYVFRDQNGDGLQNAGDLPLNGVTVRLRDGSGNPFSPDITRVSDVNGLYEFADLQPGNYIVEFVLPPTFTFTGANVGGDDAIDSDADPLTGRTAVIALAEGEDNDTVDAGLTVLASISDLVWADLNADGLVNGSDAGIDGVRVFIDQDADDTYDVGEPNAITAGGGIYLLGNLVAGTYDVQIDLTTLPGPDYVATYDRDLTADHMTSVTLNNGQALSDVDFGYRLEKPDNFTDYATGHGLTGADAQPVPDAGGNGGNPDDDYRSNILEHALCDDPTTGVPNHAGFCIDISNPSTGQMDATIVRPTGVQDVIYTLEGRDSLTWLGADGAGWFPIATIPAGGAVPAPITVTLNPDGTETLTYPDLASVTNLSSAFGLVRLVVSLDADQNGTPDILGDGTPVTDNTETFGWQNTDCNGAQCATFSHPFADKPVFTGTVVSNSGTSINVSVSAGGINLGTVIPGAGTHFLQVTSGQYEGHRFDIAGASGGSITLVSDPDIFDDTDGAQSLNSMDGLPAGFELAEAAFEVLPYFTVDEVFDKNTTYAGNQSSDPNTAARLIFFQNRQLTPGFQMLLLVDNGSEVKWIRSDDLGLQVDQGGTRLDPSAGNYVHPRLLGLTQTAIGRVADHEVRHAFNSGYNLAAAPYPMDQKLIGTNSRGYTIAAGFTGGIDPYQASELLLWNGDQAVDESATYAEFYTQFMQLDGGGMQRWTDINDPVLTDIGPTLSLEGHRAATIKLEPGQTIKAHRYLQPDPNSP